MRWLLASSKSICAKRLTKTGVAAMHVGYPRISSSTWLQVWGLNITHKGKLKVSQLSRSGRLKVILKLRHSSGCQGAYLLIVRKGRKVVGYITYPGDAVLDFDSPSVMPSSGHRTLISCVPHLSFQQRLVRPRIIRLPRLPMCLSGKI